jgi:type VI secretion system protein ImpI
MVEQPTQQLFLRVDNPQALEHGSLPSFSPYNATTTIGSGTTDWRLYDAAGSVKPLHAQILLLDGKFVLADMCGYTYINHHQDALGKHQVVALKDMDMIRIGKYQITVNIDSQDVALSYNVNHLRELEIDQLLKPHANNDWLPNAPLRSATALQQMPVDNTQQVLHQFLESKVSSMETDPLQLLYVEEEPGQIEQIVSTPITSTSTDTNLIADYTGTTRESISQPKNHSGVEAMTKGTEQKPEQQPAYQAQPVNHIVSAPLINSLGVQMEEMDTEQAHHFLSQSGHALQKAIQGLLMLYQADKQSKINLSLLGRSYQAIEDNPLRMGMSYEETTKALFSPHKSRVHLSPDHAIEESMQNIKKSQAALIEAIQESLQQLLHAFSPTHLEQRFMHYRLEQDTEANGDAWSWQMYKNYFEEMTSNRQTGLEKMFWEIFEQSYDRTMRQTENGKIS